MGFFFRTNPPATAIIPGGYVERKSGQYVDPQLLRCEIPYQIKDGKCVATLRLSTGSDFRGTVKDWIQPAFK